MRASLCLLAALPVLAVSGTSQSPVRLSPRALAGKIQARYDGIRDFTATFTQTYEGGVLRKRVVERGTLQVKRPGRMRWTYTAPEEKTFVSDGSQIYSYLPADRQVYVSPVPPENQATTAALFLTGKGNLTKDFDVGPGYPAQEASGTWALRLQPRQAERDYDWLILIVDRDSLRIRSLVAADRQGGTSTFAFADVKENTGLADTLFVFRIPRGVDVIRTGPPSR